MARHLASDEAQGITNQATNLSAGRITDGKGAARRRYDYEGQDLEAIAPRYGRLLCCNDPVRRRAVSVAKLTGLTTPENSRSRGPARGVAATAAARSGASSLTMETLLSSTRALGGGTGKSATGVSGQGAGERSIIRKFPSEGLGKVGGRLLPVTCPLGATSRAPRTPSRRSSSAVGGRSPFR
jgi:hypothetical protein